MKHSAHHDGHLHKVRNLMKGAGYKTGGQNYSVRKIAKKEAEKAVHEHEKHEHPGKPLTKLKSGGHAEGEKPKHRMDKMARGGAKKGHVAVNVVVPQGKQAMPVPMPAAQPAIARPPVAPPMPAAGPMPPRPMGMKTGGEIAHLDAGAGGGIGRLEKAHSLEKHMKGTKNKKKNV